MDTFAFAIPSVLLGLLTAPGTCELTLLTVGALLPSRRRPRSTDPIRWLTVVIPAHNEALTINRCLASLANCTRPDSVKVGVLVIADNCSDATADVARGFGAEVMVRTDPVHAGKGFALRCAFQRLLADGVDAMLVVDSDSVAEPNLLTETVKWLDSGADGVQAPYLVLNSTESPRTRIMNLAFMAFNVLRPRGRARLGLSAGILGNGFALRRSTLQAVPYSAESIVEDLEYHLQLVRSGRRIAFADSTCVRADMPTHGAAASTQRSRWEGGRLGVAARTVPTLVREISRGNVRLVEPLLDLLLLPVGFQVLILLVALAIPFGPGRWWALVSLSIICAHVSTAIIIGGGGVSELIALLAAPCYVAWKLAELPNILHSARRDMQWIRTERTGES
jgi:cellulose synthase/poly-beta-1,6-N-acetylglucosamine synthase-like glycosyltransferase